MSDGLSREETCRAIDADQPTIYALSSGRPPAGVAIIRLSGPRVRFGLETLAGSLPPPRLTRLVKIRSRNDTIIDRGLAIYFPAPASFTGEDCAELHVHGGRAVVLAVLDALAELPGFQPAEAGEFTRRAFENGKLDLVSVEGLADLVGAETEQQRRLALFEASGALSALYANWAQRLVKARAWLEAELDFSEEEDVPDAVGTRAVASAREVQEEIRRHLDGARAAEIVRDGYRVVIIGAPNAGKSSLLNAIARRDVAIVSNEAGTTRDVLTVTLDLKGLAVILTDTAGLRESDSVAEQEGVRRARAAAASADLVLELRDFSAERPNPDVTGVPENVRRLVVGSKADLAEAGDNDVVDHRVSALTGSGIGELLEKVASLAAEATGFGGEALPTRPRHVEHLAAALEELDRALADPALPSELLADGLRRAQEELGRLTGRTDVEDLLDRIFGEFCVGK